MKKYNFFETVFASRAFLPFVSTITKGEKNG